MSERANLLDVYDLWLIAVAGAMVKNTRFDPLTSLDVEQRLFADLPLLAARAATEGKVEAFVEADGSRFAVVVEAQLFADAAHPFSASWRGSHVPRASRAGRGAGVAGRIAPLARFPPAAARAGTGWPGDRARRPRGRGRFAAVRGSQFAPRLRRHVARIADHSLAADIEYVASASTSPGRALPVTHILFGGDSMRFPELGLVIGTEEVANEPHIPLPRAAAGVSRRHCSLQREGERTVLIDHSRYGTWVNGARVRERATVRPGDRVRVGTPGVEFTLISAASAARAAP